MTNVADTLTDAVAGADLVITTITVPLDPKLDCTNTDPDALLLPVGLRRRDGAGRVRGRRRLLRGRSRQYGSVAGSLYFFGLPEPVTHLAAVVAGEYDVPATGRRMFLNMGIAMDDIALSSLVLDRTAAASVGRYIEFP